MTSIQQLFSLGGQTALVTGGTRGIGQAMAIALAEAGADVILVQVGEKRRISRSFEVSINIKNSSSATDRTKQRNKPSSNSAAKQKSTPQILLPTIR